jgi:hypothetical protein
MEDSLKLNIITMASSGLAIAFAGCLVYFFRKSLVAYMPFILALPPIGVAAYVFIYRLLSQKQLVDNHSYSVSYTDILLGGFFTSAVFIFFSFFILIAVYVFKRFLN